MIMMMMLDQLNIEEGLEGAQLCSPPVDGERGNEDVNMGKRWDAGHHHLHHHLLSQMGSF